MTFLGSWDRHHLTVGGTGHDWYRKGSGPGVVVVHELPGLTPGVVGFADEVVRAGFTVALPHLFGEPGRPASLGAVVRVLPRLCMNREFTKLALGETSPVATWLRALARDLDADTGGRGVGALGMCFTGGYALAMMVEDSVVAPVVAQPSAPFAIGRARGASLNLSEEDLRIVKRRAAAGCAVLGLRYRQDPAVGRRFDTLRIEIGDAFMAVEFEGRGHSTLTEHRQQEAVDRVLAFFEERLKVDA